jgi:hypothetical protein
MKKMEVFLYFYSQEALEFLYEILEILVLNLNFNNK